MSNCTGFIQPLNLECIFVNTLSESPAIFIVLTVIFFAILAARLRMTNFTFLILMFIFGILFSRFIDGIYILIVFIVPVIVYYIFSKVYKE